MPFEVLSHTADVRLKITAATLEELFSEALRAVMGVLKNDESAAGEKITRSISVRAPDRTALLVDFLNEALATAHTRKEVYTGAIFRSFSDIAIEAELVGAPVAEFDEDIKAVTYHEADVRQNKRGEWETMLVLDI